MFTIIGHEMIQDYRNAPTATEQISHFSERMDPTVITVDFETRSAMDGRRYLVKDGVPQDGFQIRTEPVTIEELEGLYQIYKNSTPNDRDPSRQYFKAKSFEEMAPDELVNGANREEARQNLELTLLQGILNGSVTWPCPSKWFWQSAKDRDFVILRRWVLGH